MAGRSQRGLRASKFIALVVAVACPCALLPVRSAEKYSEAAVKAAFIHRFAGYVEWPAEAAAAPRLSIAIMGDAEVGRQLGALVARQSPAGRPTDVVNATRAAELRASHIVFIGARTRGDLRAHIATVTDKPVLVVTDDARGLDAGATINFLVVDQRVRFEVSLTAAEQAGLRISSDMLSVAVRVLGGKGGTAQARDAGR